MSAVIAGMVSGAVCGYLLPRTPWKVIGCSSLIVGIVLFIPIFGILFGLPAAIFIALFASVCDLVRNAIPRPQAIISCPKGMAGSQPLPVVRDNRHLLRWIAGTYLFWAAVSLINFDLLNFLTVPPLLLLFPEAIGRFLPFLLPPLLIAFLIGIVATAIYYSIGKTRGSNHYLAMLVFNGCLLLSFFISAEIYRDHLMSEALAGHHPVDFQSASFLDSVLSYRTYFRASHASFVEQGNRYDWSYAERRFFQLPY